ncbi:hypothetical protein LTR48_001277 [Friedmanniomyces endolithicus]|uniref:Uncharacterized protein n=1 Tax=Rachicladosporium monterosium TaxID=1507873 RepID=A0ABR0LDV2_9PEZI|nr:hypothetical protein LTR29_015487 [Friedmanniomyces endolithicus]KAK1093945.1 hypothetical protein LTR48_001277 [Friedmanniomyces endolithicus]KAK5147339.1 hypothetical protein LTR32_001183 [Rachicladosporium monterosium]
MAAPNPNPPAATAASAELDIDMSIVRAVRVYTTSPLPPTCLDLPPHHQPAVRNQGYDHLLEGQLLRLEDCPEGFAVWTGTETFCDMSNGLTLKLHPKLIECIEAGLRQAGIVRVPASADDRGAAGPIDDFGGISPALREAVRRTLLLQGPRFGVGETDTVEIGLHARLAREGVAVMDWAIKSDRVLACAGLSMSEILASEAKPEDGANHAAEEEVRRDSSMAK